MVIIIIIIITINNKKNNRYKTIFSKIYNNKLNNIT